MADVKISQLPAATTPLAGTEEVPVVQSGVTKKATVANILAGGGAVTNVTATAPIASSGGSTPNISLTGVVPVANGGTNATTAGTALANLGGIGTLTSTDGSVAITGAGTSRNLSVSFTTDLLVQVRNSTGATLTKGTVVYINGATGQIPTVVKAIATGDATSSQTLGMIRENIEDNATGYVVSEGLVADINTSAYTDGAQLYLSPITAGAVTITKPYAPQHLVYVGIVEYAHPTQGKIFVKVQNGFELEELHNVSAQSPSNGQTIVYNSSTQLWEKSQVGLTNGVTGILPVANGGSGTTTPSLVAGTNVSISGSWPNQTINASGGAGGGDVTGPASSTDNAIVRFDGTSGKFIQNSGMQINDTGEVNVGVWKGTEVGISYGGTGASTATQARGNLLPTYTANAGKVLAVNTGATDVEWIAAGGVGTVTSVSGTGTVNGISLSGTVTSSGSLTLGGTLSNVDLTTQITGTLPVGNGGTGATTLTGVIKGSGTSAFTAGNVSLTTEVTGTLPVGNGGTGAATFTANNVLLGNGTSAFQVVAPGASGNVLTSDGTTWASSTPAANVASISFGTTGLTPSTATTGAVTVAGTLAIANGGTGATTLAGANIAVTNAANTFTATQTFSGSTSALAAVLTDAAEVATISATAATGTINYDITTQSVLYYTTNASANWTTNFRASSGTSLNTALATGQSVTVAFLVTQGATAYYNNVVQVDGTATGVTTRWIGGAPTTGNASGIDSYRYVIIKTAAATFTVLASINQFKA